MEKARIKIDRLALEGDGVGRPDGQPQGKVAFVPYSLPGEVIVAQKREDKKNFSRWIPESIATPSTIRITPQCPLHFTPGKTTPSCGGCDWQHMPASAGLEFKKQLVLETLERIGGIFKPVVAEALASPQDFRYRNKVQIPFGWSGSRLIAGFYAVNSHHIVPFDDCLVQPEVSIKICSVVKELAQERRWEPYNKDEHRGWLRHLIMRTNSAGQALVAVVTKNHDFRDADIFVDTLRRRCPEVVGIFQNVQTEQTNVILGEKWVRLWGQARLSEKMNGLDIQFSPGAFMQVNTPAAELLYQKALDLLNPIPDWTVLDLYCGVGVMALMAARRCRRAVGIEEVPVSIADAQLNAERNRVRNISFMKSSVEMFLKRSFGRSASSFNPERLGVIIDPPRSGCSPEVLKELLRAAPARMVYVSCDPATLARDLKSLQTKYAVGPIVPVDLFPQTAHIETIVALQSRNSWNR